MKRFRLAYLCFAFSVFGCSPAPTPDASNASNTEQRQIQAAAEPKSIYTVAKYDTARDPADDLATTVSRASSENKHIILVVGGDW